MVADSEENKRLVTINNFQGQELIMTEFEHRHFVPGISEVVWRWQE